MGESFRTRLMRWGFNVFPAYRGTGARITYIASDMREARVEVPLSRRTRNYVGTIFGGSMFGAADPIYMVLFIKLLGRDYIVWDKSATITYRRPGRSTLRATFRIEPSELEEIRQALRFTGKIDRIYRTEFRDADGMVCATVEKTIHFRKKDARPAGADDP